MLNHTYTSVKNANLVDCGKKTHIASQPSSLLKENFLGEFRTELDKKKVLANLGIATDLSLEWEYIKGDICRSSALMTELDSRTKYTSKVGEFKDKVISIIEGIQYLETIVGGEYEGEEEQNLRLKTLEDTFQELVSGLDEVNKYLKETIEININQLEENLDEISKHVENINDLIKISSKSDNALILIPEDSDQLEEGETPGLYVPNLEPRVKAAEDRFTPIETNVASIQKELSNFVTKEDLGGDSFDFVESSEFNQYTSTTNQSIADIHSELLKTVKTGEDGHVDTLFVNTISKNNDDGNIKITDSFELDSGIPLDVRFVVKTIDELHSLKPLVCYAGMGVIVSDLASLYILREPANGIIDEEYIKDSKGVNWKCPEDLVIEVLTLEEYDQKEKSGSINPNMFYYIHEEVTEEPLRKDFETDEEYAEALDKWLRVLLLKYMSAVWGLEIEKLVSDKATQGQVKSLEEEIQRIDDLLKSVSGGTDDLNLKDLNDLVLLNSEELKTLTQEDGTIPTILENLSVLQNTISKDYVTKAEITTENPELEYIFVKKSAFDTYKTTLANSQAQSISTNQVNTTAINILENLLTAEEASLLFNKEPVALEKNVPNIIIMDSALYNPDEAEEDVYYYLTEDESRYVLASELDEYKTNQIEVKNALLDAIQNNKNLVGEISTLTTENKDNLVLAINELVSKIGLLTAELEALKALHSTPELG